MSPPWLPDISAIK